MAKNVLHFTASPNTFLGAKLVYKPKFDFHPKLSFSCACVLQKRAYSYICPWWLQYSRLFGAIGQKKMHFDKNPETRWFSHLFVVFLLKILYLKIGSTNYQTNNTVSKMVVIKTTDLENLVHIRKIMPNMTVRQFYMLKICLLH